MAQRDSDRTNRELPVRNYVEQVHNFMLSWHLFLNISLAFSYQKQDSVSLDTVSNAVSRRKPVW
jgi:hypothetical protein